MAFELENCLLADLRDPKKSKSNYLSIAESKFIWVQKTYEEHKALIRKMATNDPAESPFEALTRQLEKYWIVIGINAAAIGHARINGYFDQGDLKNPNNEVTYHNLHPYMIVSLLKFVLTMAPEVRMAEAAALDKQREAKRLNQEALKKKKLLSE